MKGTEFRQRAKEHEMYQNEAHRRRTVEDQENYPTLVEKAKETANVYIQKFIDEAKVVSGNGGTSVKVPHADYIKRTLDPKGDFKNVQRDELTPEDFSPTSPLYHVVEWLKDNEYIVKFTPHDTGRETYYTMYAS